MSRWRLMTCQRAMVAMMASKAPPLSSHWKTNPAGQVRRFRNAAGKVKRHNTAVMRWLIDVIDQWPVDSREVAVNDARYQVNKKAYEYLIDVAELQRIIRELQRRTGETPSAAVVQAVREAYQEGTGLAVEALRGLTDEYNRELVQVLTSQPWLRRMALVEARVFEEMEGFAGDTGRDLSRVLSQAVEIGQSPMQLKKTIRERFGVSDSRAERIARSEVTQAYRRGRLDEAEDARDRLDIRTMMVHMSALAPTTRDSHRRRHGNLYTPQEARDWWSRDANSINCRCSVTEVLVDEDGNPTTPAVVERIRSMK